MTDVPFFDPWPDPEEDDAAPDPDVDLPWLPPTHVLGVVVPLDAAAFDSADVVVRVVRAVAYRRGVELTVDVRRRPGSRPPASGPEDWRGLEPRVGVRLADGTRVGHRPEGVPPPPGEDGDGPSLTRTGTEGSGLRHSTSWWLTPFPAGASLEVVVQWTTHGVPESAATLDLAALRRAAEDERELWPPAPRPAGSGAGWFAYAPVSHAVLGPAGDAGPEVED
ncbi:hypothetical protein [Phycicoccus flavus]|uniref:hypothetical protein n=1 Tax=Phycicoccus flavus TaxID=2502783 RepID=UPI000FEBA54E|nr:hypothetical protein [Phycicoccus flavus]NHA69106.1 hypothetical protein [Phycicoccus flavus]